MENIQNTQKAAILLGAAFFWGGRYELIRDMRKMKGITDAEANRLEKKMEMETKRLEERSDRQMVFAGLGAASVVALSAILTSLFISATAIS